MGTWSDAIRDARPGSAKAKAIEAGKIVWEAIQEYTQYGGSNMAAALSFYSVFSIAPLLVVIVAVVGIFFGDEAARGEVFAALNDIIGSEQAAFVQDMVKAASQQESGGVLASIVGIVTLLYGSSKVFTALRSGLNVIWQVEPKKSGGIMDTIKDYALSLALVPGFGVLFLAMMISSTVVSAFGDWIAWWASIPEFLPRMVDILLSWFFLSVMFGLLFKLLPDLRLSWKNVALGAAITSALFVVGKTGIGFYLGQSSTGSVFGAAGTMAVLLMWFFLSAQIFFLGASLTHSIYRARNAPELEQKKRDAAIENAPEIVEDKKEIVICEDPVLEDERRGSHTLSLDEAMHSSSES